MAVTEVPKQARSHLTRARIVEAAALTLVEHGYQKTSTPRIAAEAEVSQGALFKHFPSKTLLLAACVERLLASFVAGFREDMTARVDREAPIKERVEVAVRGLWRVFRRPEMRVVFEVYVAAWTDRDLARALSDILGIHRENILTEARELFPELSDAADFAAVVDAVVYAMQGVVLGLFTPDAEEALHIAFFERLAQRELEAVMLHGVRR